jgi:ABC-type arginine transport system permease subunit
MAEYFVWIAFYSAQIYYSWRYVDTLMTIIQYEDPTVSDEDKDNDWKQMKLMFGLIVGILFLVFTGLSLLFLSKLNKYNSGMIEFHKFINGYR